jgi:hypothetical protein
MTPEDLAKSGTESGQQRALFCWANMYEQRQKWPELKWMYAVPNGGARSGSQGATLKAEGLKPGVSDICLPIKRQGYSGFYIEMKKPGGGIESDEQIEFGTFVVTQGFLYRCCHTYQDARDSIIWYMGE